MEKGNLSVVFVHGQSCGHHGHRGHRGHRGHHGHHGHHKHEANGERQSKSNSE